MKKKKASFILFVSSVGFNSRIKIFWSVCYLDIHGKVMNWHCFIYKVLLPIKYFILMQVDWAFRMIFSLPWEQFGIYIMSLLSTLFHVFFPIPQPCPQSSKVSYAILTFWQNLLLLYWAWSLCELPKLWNILLHSVKFSTLCEVFDLNSNK